MNIIIAKQIIIIAKQIIIIAKQIIIIAKQIMLIANLIIIIAKKNMLLAKIIQLIAYLQITSYSYFKYHSYILCMPSSISILWCHPKECSFEGSVSLRIVPSGLLLSKVSFP